MILCVKHVSAIFTIARSLCVRCEIMSTVLIELQEVPTPVIAITKITMQCWGAFNSFPHVLLLAAGPYQVLLYTNMSFIDDFLLIGVLQWPVYNTT